MLRLAVREKVTGLRGAFHRGQRLVDNAGLEFSLLRVVWGVGEGRDDALTFVMESLGYEPSRGLGEEEDTDDEGNCEDHLQGNGHPP